MSRIQDLLFLRNQSGIMTDHAAPEKAALLAGRDDRIAKARQRFGKPFAYEKGSDWQPKAVPVLTAWLQSRGKS
jgi:hypothetical protein